MTIDAWLAAARPESPAIFYEGETLSYGAFDAQVAAHATALTARGIGRGDRVVWYGLNHPEVFVLLFACARIGAMLLPLNWRLAEGEIRAIIDNAAPGLMIYDAHFAPQAQALGVPAFAAGALPAADAAPQPAALDPQASIEDPVLLVYTSGSTGRPKGVVLTQAALVANAKMSVQAHELTAGDRVLNALPLFHVGGLNILPTPAFSIGACVALHARFDPVAMARALPEVHHAITVPTVLEAVMQTPDWSAPLGALKSISIGSTDVPLEMVTAVQARGVAMIQIYGATETSPLAIYQSLSDAVATTGSIGKAGSLCEIRLVDQEVDVPDGTPGEIWVRGENTLKAYWQDPGLTRAALQDGWYKTGDVAIRRDGLYYFTDRIKHVIISGGENIYPAEVERVLRRVPGVREVAVVGRPDPKWGEVPVAVVAGTVARADLLAAQDGQLARYKHAKDVVFVEALPRNAMGKVVAAVVRQLV